MSTPLRGAIIGFGNVAERGHLPAWLARDDMEIVAVAEPDPARRARAGELLPAARLHGDPGELFREAAALDFVDIATPPALHAPLIVAAAAAGLHVVCEKPLVVSVSEYHRVRDAVREAGVVLFTVHNWKYSEPFQRVRALLDADSIGPLRSIMLETIRDGCARSARVDWRMSAGLAGGGILVDHGWHALYMIQSWISGEPERVSGRLETKDGRLSLVMHLIKLDDGTHVWVQRVGRPAGDRLDTLERDAARQIEDAVRELVLKDFRRAS